MPRKDLIDVEGTIVAALGGGQYEIKPLDENEPNLRAQLCGKMKKHGIRVIIGDRVRIGVSPYDESHGIITWKHRLTG